MNYTEIKQLALGYADREDVEVVNNMDNFIRIVESRINQRLKVQKMSVRSLMLTVQGQEYYGLPPDFNGMRDIEYTMQDSQERVTLEYINPKQANDYNNKYKDVRAYTIIADQLQIIAAPQNGVIEMVYYKKLPPLSGASNVNWVSDEYPELYTYGILVEISSFVKDVAAVQMWEARFQGVLDSMNYDDALTRWSGTTLQVRTDNGI